MGVSKNRGQTPQNGWFIMENRKTLLKMDDLGVPLFLETPISGQLTLVPKAELMAFWRDSLWCELG